MNKTAENPNQQIAPQQEHAAMTVPPSTGDMLFQDGMMEQLEKFSIVMSEGRSTIPQHLQGNKADCMAVVMQSAQWKMNPFAVAQKTHLIKGVLGYEAQLVNAVITAMAPTEERIRFEWFGEWKNVIGNFKTKAGNNGSYQVPNWTPKDEEGCGVKVWATFKGEDEPRVLELLLSQATVRNSTLWASDPKQQLAYLAIKRWSRLYCPDVIMGVYTPDELQEVPAPKDITPVVDDLNQKLNDEKIRTLTENIEGAKSVEALSVIGKVIANEPKEVQNKVRGPYDKKIKALKTAAKKDEKTAAAATEAAIAKGAPSYPEIMDLINKAKEPADIESALDMSNHLPEDQQAEIQQAAGNALEKLEQ